MSRKRLDFLYTQKGKSAFEVSKIFGCSEHKVNYWLRKHGIPKRSIADAMYRKNNPTGDPFKVREIKTIEDAKLYGLGLGLYWGEGNKKNRNSIRLGNTNPGLIRKFLEFLVNTLGVDKERLKFGLQIFGDMSPRKTLKFWLAELKDFGIKKSQFFKITVTPSRSVGNYKEKSKFGVLCVNFFNAKLKKIIDSMLPL